MTVEDRVIKSSLKMIEKSGETKNEKNEKNESKHAHMTLAIFAHFAVFPEDVPVPLDVFTVLTRALAGPGCEPSKRTTMKIRACLKTLLNYNLLKGSTSEGSGVFMHGMHNMHYQTFSDATYSWLCDVHACHVRWRGDRSDRRTMTLHRHSRDPPRSYRSPYLRAPSQHRPHSALPL